jgi:AcrR family transcriptional regulator
MPAAPAPQATLAPRERARTVRRQALLEAAEAVFAERGFERSTMAEIAARAGYSAANLYNVFASKEALFLEIVSHHMQALSEVLQPIADVEAPFAETNRRLIEALFRFVIEKRAFFRIFMQASNGQPWNVERFGDDVVRMRDEQLRRAEDRVARAIARGECAPGDPAVYASLIHGTTDHLLIRWIQRGGTPDELWAQADAIHTALCRALGVTA